MKAQTDHNSFLVFSFPRPSNDSMQCTVFNVFRSFAGIFTVCVPLCSVFDGRLTESSRGQSELPVKDYTEVGVRGASHFS